MWQAYPMRATILALAVALLTILPAFAHAQYVRDIDEANPYEYRDVDDGQLLKLAAYLLTPFGMGLEWGVTRPLHYVATQTSIAPLLSGDKDTYTFGQNNNADFVPPGTFGPEPLNLSNAFVPAPLPQTAAEITAKSLKHQPRPFAQSALH